MSDIKTEDKVPCEVCGDMVSKHHLAQANHMKKHSPAASVAKSNVKGVNSEEDRKILERALAAQESFRTAPQVFLSEDSTDNNAAIVSIYAPEAMDKFDNTGKLIKKASRHPFFANRDKLAQWANRGYVPVIGDNGEFVQNEGGDVLCTCDRELFESREKKAQNESTSIVRSLHKNLAKDRVQGIPDGDNKDLNDVSLKVTEETIEI